jgi:hypothetical protein
MREVAKVLAFRAPEEITPEETRSPETRSPETRSQKTEEPGEPDLDAAATGMAMLLRLALRAMKSR